MVHSGHGLPMMATVSPAATAVLAREPARERADPRGQLAPRRLAPDAERLRAERDALGPRPRALDEQAGQSARAQRLEIHAGRIIPEGIVVTAFGALPPLGGLSLPAAWLLHA